MGCTPSSHYSNFRCLFCHKNATNRQKVGHDRWGHALTAQSIHQWYSCDDHEHHKACVYCNRRTFPETGICKEHKCTYTGCNFAARYINNSVCFKHRCRECQGKRSLYVYTNSDGTRGDLKLSIYCKGHKCPTETCTFKWTGETCVRCGLDQKKLMKEFKKKPQASTTRDYEEQLEVKKATLPKKKVVVQDSPPCYNELELLSDVSSDVSSLSLDSL